MGGALARHLVGKHELIVLDRNPVVLATFESLGARVASNPAELGRLCDVVLLCLPRSSDVGEVLFGIDGLTEGLAPGTIVIDQTSGVPEVTQGFAQRLALAGVDMLDAPVSGAMAMAIAGKVSIIVSGPRKVFEKVRPLFENISPNVFYCGDRVGNGQTMKSVNNMLNAGCRLATLELVALGRKAGLDLVAMTEAINHSTARNFTSQGMLIAIAEGRQSTKFGLGLQIKDANQAIELGIGRGVPMPVSTAVRALLQIGLSSLGEGAQLEQMIGVIENMAGVRFVDPAAHAPQEGH
jgi:3-hydroxyisobutyrate dehydrogenase